MYILFHAKFYLSMLSIHSQLTYRQAEASKLLVLYLLFFIIFIANVTRI
jgi:hypothetical protein